MNTHGSVIDVAHRIPIRWPFRLLAAVVVLAGVAATAGMTLAAWHQGTGFTHWQLLASLPGLVWFGRLCWYAAARGQVPVQEYWPFASQHVLTCYGIVWLLVIYA